MKPFQHLSAGGRTFDRGTGHRWPVVALVAIAACFVAIPRWDSLAPLALSYVIIGFGLGMIDTGANTFVAWGGGPGVAATLNSLHLCFGIGALIVPVLIGWSLNGAAIVVAVAMVGIAALLSRTAAPAPKHGTETGTGAAGPLLAMVAAWFSLYVGFELGYAGWVHTYAEDVGLGAGGATALTVVFWASFTSGRLIAVPLARSFGASHILVGSAALGVIGAVGLVAADGAGLVWPATAVVGLALAPQFATMLALVEHRAGLSGSATGWIVASAGIGGLAFPFLVGQLYDESRPQTVTWMTLATSIATAAWMVVVLRRLPDQAPVTGAVG